MAYPIILIGMHRSGTSMVSRLLESAGLFMGINKDKNNEAQYFVRLNEWILFQAGASWDNPFEFPSFCKHDHASTLITDFLLQAINRPITLRFLGWKFFKQWNLAELDFPWGWKDPRTTLTLPLWLQVFPQAKVIHVYRHGVDVAYSLLQRSEEKYDVRRILYRKLYYVYWLFGPKVIPLDYRRFDSVSLLSLENGFDLWEFYIQQAYNHAEHLTDRVMHIRYEDILDSPQEQVRVMLEFCGLDANSTHLQKIMTTINPSRAYAYRKSEELLKFSETVKDRLQRFAYEQ